MVSETANQTRVQGPPGESEALTPLSCLGSLGGERCEGGRVTLIGKKWSKITINRARRELCEGSIQDFQSSFIGLHLLVVECLYRKPHSY